MARARSGAWATNPRLRMPCAPTSASTSTSTRTSERDLILADNGRVISNNRPIRLLGIGGSTRQGSKSLTLLQSALRVAEDAGASTTLADVRELALPIFDNDLPLEAYPLALTQLIT